MEFLKMTVESVQNVHSWVFGVVDYEFIFRFTKFNMAGSRWWMKFSEITVKSVQNVHPRVFGVADYKFIVRFTKFNTANSRWWMTSCKKTNFL